MSNIQIDTTTEKDAVRLTFSAPTESEVLTDALHTVLHLLRATCKMGTVDTKQFNSLIETACELEDTIQRMHEDNTLPAAEVKVAAGVPTPTAATTFNDQLIEATRQVLLIHKKDDVELIVSSNSTISNHRLRRMENVLKAIESSEGTDAVDYATQMAVLALNGLLILHNAKDPIRNIQAFSMAVLSSIRRTLIAKNHDYGNSFGDQLTCRGNIVYVIRMEDKIRRLRTLLTTDAQVKDESIEDTLRDIIGYCILFIHHTKFQLFFYNHEKAQTTNPEQVRAAIRSLASAEATATRLHKIAVERHRRSIPPSISERTKFNTPMNEQLRRRIMNALSEYLSTLEEGTEKYERVYDLYLDVKWAGTPLNECNPKGY